MDEPLIQPMRKDEASTVLRGQRKAFSPTFGLFLSRPKEGLVAESDGSIVGAVTYKTIATGKGRVGYLDVAYVDRSQRGKKLGGRLYKAAMDKLRSEGCEAITATIRDDNRASWKIMERNGCTVCPFYRLLGKFGLVGALRIALNAHLAYALGHELWATGESSRPSTLSAMAGFFVINLLLMLIASRGNFPFTLGTLAVLAAEILGGRLGTLGQPARWYLQRPHAALPLSLFVSLVRGLLPSIASWQPVEDTYDMAHRPRLLGRTSFFAWTAIFLVTAASFIVLAWGSPAHLPAEILSGSLTLGLMYLVYRSLAFFPFESFGGRRVYDWKPRVFYLMAVLSAVMVVMIFILMP